MRAATATEAQLQKAIVDTLRWRGCLVFAVPNGGKRAKIEAARMVGQGTLAGAPDLVVILPGGGTLWLEVKTAKGRVEPHQAELHDRMRRLGHDVRVVRSIDDALASVDPRQAAA